MTDSERELALATAAAMDAVLAWVLSEGDPMGEARQAREDLERAAGAVVRERGG